MCSDNLALGRSLVAAICLAVLLSVPCATAGGSDAGRVPSQRMGAEPADGLNPDLWSLEIGAKTRLAAFDRADGESAVVLELERMRVFAPGAKIVVHGDDGDSLLPIPQNRYFKGHVAGEKGTTALVSVLESGEIRGLVALPGRLMVLGRPAVGRKSIARVEYHELDSAAELDHEALGFGCETDSLIAPPEVSGPALKDVAQEEIPKAASYTARIAVETDTEFFNKFGNATDAANYVADVIAFGSTIYGTEVNTSWWLSHLSLWSGGSDPWGQQSSNCGLYEFGRYWNDNNGGISRTTAHFMSGKNSNSGIAWVGVLCRGPFDVNIGTSCSGLSPGLDNYGGAYGYTGGMDANFNINNPSSVWDIVAVTHEIGHNFNSPHTHCYEDLEGNSNQIDQCYSGEPSNTYKCYSGGTSLPSGCPGGGNECGTIMSYCHFQSGGMGNIALTLGQGHPYGIEPGRVPGRMFAHVQSKASSNPGCLDYVAINDIFDDGFEGGDTGGWSESTP